MRFWLFGPLLPTCSYLLYSIKIHIFKLYLIYWYSICFELLQFWIKVLLMIFYWYIFRLQILPSVICALESSCCPYHQSMRSQMNGFSHRHFVSFLYQVSLFVIVISRMKVYFSTIALRFMIWEKSIKLQLSFSWIVFLTKSAFSWCSDTSGIYFWATA